MEELINKNKQFFEEVVETLPNNQKSIDDVTKNYQYYLGSIKNEVFEIKDNETYSEAIKRGEGIFDRIDETERRRKLVIEKSQETINQIEIKLVREKMERIIQECKSDEETLGKARNELIDKIISIEEMIMKDKIIKIPEETDTITTEFNKKKEEWEKHYYSDYLEMKKRKEEFKQLEEWTNRKVRSILFDSNIDDWNKNTSVFDQRIINKEHIIIIIEDEDGNKFGGYVNSKIDKYCYINDSKSFVFSLKSNGRMKGMKKFDIKQTQYAFYLNNQIQDCLFKFGFGNDIFVCKENYKTKSWCEQQSFEYNEIENALCGKFFFTPKQIIVIEMKLKDSIWNN
ncbi:predicted protein [Entamoeba histolytica]